MLPGRIAVSPILRKTSAEAARKDVKTQMSILIAIISMLITIIIIIVVITIIIIIIMTISSIIYINHAINITSWLAKIPCLSPLPSGAEAAPRPEGQKNAPEIDTSENIAYVQWRFPMDVQLCDFWCNILP